MAIQASKPNSRIFLLLGIVLAALAFGGVLFALRQSSGGQTVGIVVAAKQLAAGTTITADMVTQANVPTSAVPGDAYTDPTAVVGKTTTVNVAPNTPFVPSFFTAPPLTSATTSSSNGGTAVSAETQITKGYVAMAIPTAGNVPAADQSGGTWSALSGDEVSDGYYIQPGDHIDILVEGGVSPTSLAVRFAFQDVPVLRVGTAGNSSGAPTMLLVEVPRSQAETLAALTVGSGHSFTIRYVLRPQSEWGKMAADGSSYAPNYESTTGPALPTPADNGWTPADTDALFSH